MEIAIYRTVATIDIPIKKIKRIVFFVFKQESADGDISLHFIGDKKMKALNTKHRHKNKTTDVLSFATGEKGMSDNGGRDWGDIFIDVPHIRRQARHWDENFETEMARMIIHGILHILGYDHIGKAEAKTMFAKQENYLDRCAKL